MQFTAQFTACVLALAGTFALYGCDGDAAGPALGAPGQSVPEAAAARLAPGDVETVVSLGTENQPEGIAVARRGDIYVSNTRMEPTDARVVELLRIDRDGAVSVVAEIGPAGTAAGGLGVVIHPRGDVFLAVASSDAATHGVWRIGRSGSVRRLPGSSAIPMPNALAFDRRGNLYATDSRTGAIWRFARGSGAAEPWVRDPLLEPLPSGDPNDPLPEEAVGANGIAFFPPRTLYVANTERGLVARIPILPDESPGTPGLVAQDLLLLTIDGLAVDVRGAIYAAIPGARILPLLLGQPLPVHSVVRIDPESGAIAAVTTEDEAFDFPTSLAFATGGRDRKSLFVANAAFELLRELLGPREPKVVQVGTGAPGFPE